MPFSMSQSVMEAMPSGAWNDFTDLPAEFLSQFGTAADFHSDSRRNCFYSSSFVYFATAMDDMIIVACLIATIFNLVVIVCSTRLYSAKGDTLHLFILNMTIGDCILTSFCHPYEIITRRYAGAQIHSVTVFLNFANWVGLAVSGLSLTLLNVDKLIFFCWPFKYDTWMSSFRAKLFCYLAWIISIGFATYYWVYSYLYFIDRKIGMQKRLEIQSVFLAVFLNGGRLSPINKFFYEVFTVVFCVIPIVSSLLVSCYLYDLTRRKRKLTIGEAPLGKSENKTSSFAFIFATTLWTSCSLLPYRLANLARIHMISWATLECDTRQIWSWFTWCMLYLLIMNPIINPFITAFAYAPYRTLICDIYVKSPFGQNQDNTNKQILRGDDKKKRATKNAELEKVFRLELQPDVKDDVPVPVKIPDENVRKAPLANLPSICSCGSLITPDSLGCTRF